MSGRVERNQSQSEVSQAKISQSGLKVHQGKVSIHKGVRNKLSSVSRQAFDEVKYVSLYPENLKTKLSQKTRLLNPKIYLSGKFNRFATVIRKKGMAINTLLSDYHAPMKVIGAEHVMTKSKTGGLIDMQFFSGAKFLENLENCGGRVGKLSAKIPPGTEYYLLKREELPSISLKCIEFDKKELQENRQARLQEERDKGKIVVPGKKTGVYFSVSESDFESLNTSGVINEKGRFNKSRDRLVKVNLPEPCSCFKLPSKGAEEMIASLKKLGIKNSPWILIERPNSSYLVRKEDKERFLNIFSTHHSFKKNEPSQEERGVVLMSRGSEQSYEKSSHEMLSFLLEGCDVMVYNYPGVGLSTGSADRKSLMASTEAAYDYLKNEKKFEDEKILATGLCFGSVITGFLGKKHPNIHLMLEQPLPNLAALINNGWDRAFNLALAETREEKLTFSKPLRIGLLKLSRNNRLIRAIVRRVLKSYTLVDYVVHNKGQKLIGHAVKDDSGRGGDSEIDDYQIDVLTNKLGTSQDDKVPPIRLALNPGAIHGNAWGHSKNSRDVVRPFLQEIGVAKPFF